MKKRIGGRVTYIPVSQQWQYLTNTATAPAPAPTPTQDDDDVVAVPAQQNTPTPIPQANGFMPMDDALAAQIRAANAAFYSPAVEAARKTYIIKNITNSKGYTPSQDLNWRLEQGLPMNGKDQWDANLRYMNQYLPKGMHQLGYDVQLQRGAHENVLQALGIQNYANMNINQIKQLIVGATWQGSSFGSTSYDINKNPFLSSQSGSGVSGGREVILNISAHKSTKVMFGAKDQSEVILDKGVNYKVTDARFTGAYATPRNGGYKPVIEIDVEVWS